MIWERIMSWLAPSRFRPGQKAQLDALMAESLEQKCLAEATAETIKAEAAEDQERAVATVTKIEERIAAQERRAAARRASPQLDAALETLKLIQRH